MQFSYNGFVALAREEALVCTPYQDGQHLSYGFGHNGPDVQPGMRLTPLEAFKLLRQDTKQFEDFINKCLKVEILQREFDMLVLFTHNKFHLVENLTDIYNEGGDTQEVISRLVTYNKNAKGEFKLGLVGRRYREGLIGDRGDYGSRQIKLFDHYPGDYTVIDPPSEQEIFQ